MRSFLIAWHFLMGIPLRAASCQPTLPELAGSMAWFPLVGAAIGTVLALADLVLSGILARGLVDALVVVLLVLLTRALHQDGLSDTFDGLAGGTTPAERLMIMRDPRIGGIGATALVLSLGLRYAALLALPSESRLPLLVCMPAVGRWAMVLAASTAPTARPDSGLAHAFMSHLSVREIRIATLLLTGVAWSGLGTVPTILVVTASAAVTVIWVTFCRRMFGGMSGDTLGALNEIIEVAFLIAGPMLLRSR